MGEGWMPKVSKRYKLCTGSARGIKSVRPLYGDRWLLDNIVAITS